MRRKIVIRLALVALAAMTLAPGVLAEEAAVAPKDLYAKKCAMCHGLNGVAKDVGKPSGDFNDPEWQKTHDVASIVKITKAGKNKMPPYAGKLTDEQMQQIAEYIKTLQ